MLCHLNCNKNAGIQRNEYVFSDVDGRWAMFVAHIKCASFHAKRKWVKLQQHGKMKNEINSFRPVRNSSIIIGQMHIELFPSARLICSCALCIYVLVWLKIVCGSVRRKIYFSNGQLWCLCDFRVCLWWFLMLSLLFFAHFALVSVARGLQLNIKNSCCYCRQTEKAYHTCSVHNFHSNVLSACLRQDSEQFFFCFVSFSWHFRWK